tara:strand:- start:870 stop:1142 length:273 start_codon:yes stop_codon:yes gene_type:complete
MKTLLIILALGLSVNATAWKKVSSDINTSDTTYTQSRDTARNSGVSGSQIGAGLTPDKYGTIRIVNTRTEYNSGRFTRIYKVAPGTYIQN